MDKRRGPKPPGRAPRKGELEEFRKRKQRSRAGVNIPLLITAALVFVFVSTHMVSGLSAMLTTPEIATISPDFGNVAAPAVFTGVIIRDETVYTAERDGVLEFHADHLERVRPGQAVAAVSEESYVAGIHASIEELDRQILEMQARRGEISAFSTDVARMNEQLQAAVDSHLPRLTNSSFDELYNMAENARRMVGIRNQMLLTEDRGSVRGMVDEREHAVQRLDGSVMSVSVQRGGILSYIVDGLENILTIENMRSLEPEQTRQSVDHTTLHRLREVSAGDEIFKVVNSNIWYIAVYMPFEAVSEWQANDLRRVYMQSGESFREMDTYVEHISHGETSSFVVLRVTRFLSDFMDRRAISFRLTSSLSDSLKIPAHVVTTMDAVRIPVEFVNRPDMHNPSVIRQGSDNSADQTVLLNIYRRNNEFVYILIDTNNLSIRDILLHPTDASQTHIIEEIVALRGVFVLNFGFADFEEINLGDEVAAIDGHIVLDAAANRRITPSSRIILDTTGLHDGQRLLMY
ncbi:MAG: hypothetical protein FWE20_06865 [Defluviitaleaceae bacterium]|nr:hypothetical protein [Defluviitaleaceae bacterium]